MSILNLPIHSHCLLFHYFYYLAPLRSILFPLQHPSSSCRNFLELLQFPWNEDYPVWTIGVFVSSFSPLHLSVAFLGALKWICIWDFIHMEKLIDRYLINSFNTVSKLIRVKELNLLLHGSLFWGKWWTIAHWLALLLPFHSQALEQTGVSEDLNELLEDASVLQESS